MYQNTVNSSLVSTCNCKMDYHLPMYPFIWKQDIDITITLTQINKSTGLKMMKYLLFFRKIRKNQSCSGSLQSFWSAPRIPKALG